MAPPDSNNEDDDASRQNKTAKTTLLIGVTLGKNSEVQNINPQNNPTANAARYGFGISSNNDMFEFP